MGRWELLSRTAALVRQHFLAHTAIVLPAVVATYTVNTLATFYKVDIFALRDHPLKTFVVVSSIRFVQFFLGWLFVAFEFAVILEFLKQEDGGSKSILEAIERARSKSLQITALSWAIYWRALLLTIPIFVTIIALGTFAFKLSDVIGGRWLAQIETLLAFSIVALLGSKWLLAFPETVLRAQSARQALRRASKEWESLHENMLILSLFFVIIAVFSTSTWPHLLHYVYVPADWPEPVVEALQKWFTPATSLIFDTWATMVLFVGTYVLWESGEHKQEEIATYADSFA